MSEHYAEPQMYVAPQQVQQSNELWLTRIFERFGVNRLNGEHFDRRSLWRAPELLLSQTCGYPLMTELRGQVHLIGRPRYELLHSSAGDRSLLLTSENNPFTALADFYDSRGVLMVVTPTPA